jgi:tape measure domain-containing protein
MSAQTISKLNIHLGASTAGLQQGFAQARGQLEGFSSQLQGLGGRLSALFGAGAMIGAGSWALKLAADLQTASVAFEVMLGDANQAQQLLKDLKEFSAATPFELGDLQNGARTLLAFGIEAKQILPTMQMLGDVAGGDAQKLQSLTMVFGQIASAGKLTGGDLLQLINVGFNPLQEIAKKTGKSVAELKDEMSKGQISFEMVRDAFASATAEGGRFHGMMDKMSKTLTGRFSTLKDNVGQLALSFGEILLPAAEKIVAIGNDLLAWANSLDAVTQQNIIRIGLWAAGFTAAIVLIPKVVAGFRAVIAAYKALAISQAIAQAFSGPKGWLVLAGAALAAAGAVYAVNASFESANKEIADAGKQAEDTAEKATEMADAATGAAEATEQLAAAQRDWAAEGKRVTEEMRSPLEVYVDRVAYLDELLNQGAIQWETYGRAVGQAQEQLFDATKQAKEFREAGHVDVGAVTRFSTSGFSAVNAGRREAERQLELARQQFEEETRQTELLKSIEEKTKERRRTEVSV